jgi:hypothetical protein
MFASNACRFAILAFLSLSANAESIRGAAQRELTEEDAVNLRTAGSFAILAKSGISNTGSTTAITGDLGVSPIKAGAITGFVLSPPTTSSTSGLDDVTGSVYASDYAEPTPGRLTDAVSDMQTAYTDAAGRPNTDGARNNIEAGLIGGERLTPGVYTFTTGVDISADITFQGDANDIFIIQIAGGLIEASDVNVILEDAGGILSGNTGYNGPHASNIFWQVAGAVNIGADAHMEGVLLAATAVTFITGSSLNGRVLTQTACNLDSNTIAAPTPSV